MDKEREKAHQNGDIEFIPEELEIPEEIEAKEGVKATRTQFTTTIKADDGTHMVSSPSTKKVSIQLPTDEDTLETMSKDDVESSSTWSGAYWLRLIKKAVFYGWDIVKGQKTPPSSTNS